MTLRLSIHNDQSTISFISRTILAPSVPLAAVVILLVLLVPLPAFALDVLISFNLDHVASRRPRSTISHANHL